MIPKELVVVNASDKGVVTISGKYNNKVSCLGASVSFMPEAVMNVSSFSIGMKNPEKGMVAISVLVPSGKSNETHTFFLNIEWNEGEEKPFIDLQDQWYPSDPERIAQLHYGLLEMVVDGVKYSSSSFWFGEDKKTMRQVKNGSHICQYIDGKITKEQFKEVVGAPAVEADLREELIRLREEVQTKETSIATLNHKLEAKCAELIELSELAKPFFKQVDDLTKTVSDLSDKTSLLEGLLMEKDEQLNEQKFGSEKTFNALFSLGSTHSSLKSSSRTLCNAVNKQWFKRPSVRNSLEALKELLNEPSQS